MKSNWGWSDYREDRIRKNFRQDRDDFNAGWEEELGLVQLPDHKVPETPLLKVFGGKAETPEPSMTGRKSPGRNDPCPCGSGKKFKKWWAAPVFCTKGYESTGWVGTSRFRL